MNESRMMGQVVAVFGAFMTFFYLGVGLFLLFSDAVDRIGNYNNYKFLWNIMGVTFLFYGVYRGYRSYVKFREVFFSKSDETDQ
jgi:hypothetical protein